MNLSRNESCLELEIAELKKQLDELKNERDLLKDNLLQVSGNAPAVYPTPELSLVRDSAERTRMEDAFKQKDRLLHAIAEALFHLLTEKEPESSISAALEIIGKAIEVDRVYIFENHQDPLTGGLLMSQRFEWCLNSILPQIDNPLLQNLSYMENFSRWLENLSDNKSIKGIVSDFPERERNILELQGIISILVVPIIFENRFWGFIGFDDCKNERIWDLVEETILTTAAISIGNALMHKRTEEALKKSEKDKELVLNTTQEIFAYLDTDLRIQWANKSAMDAAKRPLETMIGRHCYEVWHCSDKPCDVCGMAKILETGSSQEWTILNPEGQWWFLRGYPVLDETGKVISLIEFGLNITAKKKSEEELRSTKEFYQVLTDSINDAIFVDDAITGKIIYVNQRMCEMYGYSFEEALGVGIGELSYGVPPYSQVNAAEWLRKAQTGEPQTFKWLAKHRSGTLFWVEVSIRYACIGNDERFFVTVRDISERMHNEEELRKSEERFRVLVESSPNSIMALQDGKYVFTNTAGAKMLGYEDPSELIGFSPADFVSPRHYELVKSRINNVKDGKFNPSVEVELCKKDGSMILVETISVPTTINGKPAVLIIGQDISQRKQTEQALRESERRFRDILETVHLVAITMDLSGKITFCNDYVLHLTGWKYEEVIDKNWMDVFLPADDRDKVRNMIMLSLKYKTIPPHYENPIITKDGNLRNIQWDNTLLYNHAEELIGIASIGRDITEKEQLEEQLRHSQKMEAVGQLAGGVAHDFNNLLMGIIGYSDLLLDNFNENDPAWEGIQEIKKAGERAASLTRQLLAFSRRQMLQPEIINLNIIISDLEKMLRRLIGENIQLTASLDCDLVNVKADPGQIEQVIVNLCVNARDAMPHGGKLIIKTSNLTIDSSVVTHFFTLPHGNYVMMEIMDTGTGIPPEIQIRIFDPFFTTKREGKGTGLGLSTVYGIIQQSGGQIYLESETGIGSNFIIILPQCSETVKTQKTEEQRDFQRGNETILIVEDEDLVRTITTKILKLQGYRIIQASTPAEALLISEQYTQPIHLLLTDIIMPQMTGRVLAERLLKISPALKVLYMSGYTDDEIIQNAVMDSALEFIQKPFSPSNLTKKVRQILDKGAHP